MDKKTKHTTTLQNSTVNHIQTISSPFSETEQHNLVANKIFNMTYSLSSKIVNLWENYFFNPSILNNNIHLDDEKHKQQEYDRLYDEYLMIKGITAEDDEEDDYYHDSKISIDNKIAMLKIKNILLKAFNIIDIDITNSEIKQAISHAYFICYDKKVKKLYEDDKAELSDKKDDTLFRQKRKEIYDLFLKYSKQPFIQHEIGKLIYKYEFINRHLIFNGPPFNKEEYKILNERLNNLDDYEEFFKQLNVNSTKNYSLSDRKRLGISHQTTIYDLYSISTSSRSLTDQKGKGYILEENQVSEMLTTEKHLLMQPINLTTPDNCKVQLSYYVGEYKGREIIYLERVYYNPIDTDKNIQTYSFGFFLGDVNINHKHFVNLIRADINPHDNHYNKIENNAFLSMNKQKTDFDKFDANIKYNVNQSIPSYYNDEQSKKRKLEKQNKEIENGKIIPEKDKIRFKTYNAHIHINSRISSIIFPGAPGIDAVIIPETNVFNYSYNDLDKQSKNIKFRNREEIEDFINKMSMQEVNRFEKMYSILKNITHTSTNNVLWNGFNQYESIRKIYREHLNCLDVEEQEY